MNIDPKNYAGDVVADVDEVEYESEHQLIFEAFSLARDWVTLPGVPGLHPSDTQLEDYFRGAVAARRHWQEIDAHVAWCTHCADERTPLSGVFATALAAWAAIVSSFDPQRWAVMPAGLSYAGGAFASAPSDVQQRMHYHGDTLRWSIAIEEQHHVVYVEAAESGLVKVLVYDPHTVTRGREHTLHLEHLDVRDTQFAWRCRADLGLIDGLLDHFGSYDVAVAVERLG